MSVIGFFFSFYIISYLHEFDVSSFVFFSVGLCLSCHLKIMDLFLQRLFPEQSLVSFPLTPPQVLLLA